MGLTEIASLSELDAAIARAKGGLVVVDFHATWCGPCKMIAPKYEAWAQQFPAATFLKCDVDQARDVASKYSISAMPSFVFLKDGRQVEMVRGANPAGIEAAIRKHLGPGGSTAGHSWGQGARLGDGAANRPMPHPAQLTAGITNLDPQIKVILGLLLAYLVLSYLFA